MLRNKIQSRNLVAVGWENNILEVEFHPKDPDQPGPVYQYTGVSKDTYWAMTMDPHPGQFFYAKIRGKYPTKKVGI